MRVSEVIQLLQIVEHEFGDLEFVNVTNVPEGYYIDFHKSIEVISSPEGDTVCALMDLNEIDNTEDDNKPTLKVIK